MRSGFRRGLVALAAVATSLAATTAPATAAEATGCSARVDQVGRAVAAGRAVTAGQLRAVQRCVLGDAGAATAAAAPAEEVTAAAVTASFENQHACYNFNSDGTISSAYGGPFMVVILSGGYVGVPGVFTAFAYSGTLIGHGAATFSSFGLTFGPFSVELFTILGMTNVISGTQVPSCPG